MSRRRAREINRNFDNNEGENEAFHGLDSAMFGDRKDDVKALGFSRDGNGAVLWGGFKLSHKGLSIDEQVDENDWLQFGEALAKIQISWDWMVADWLAYGNYNYGDKVYEKASALFGKSDRTWEDYTYVARNVQFSERSENLPFMHHKVVAPYADTPNIQKELLNLAETHRLSYRHFSVIIPVYLAGDDWSHLLPTKSTALDKQVRIAEEQRQKIMKKIRGKQSKIWIEFARQEAARWQSLIQEIENLDE